MLNHVLLHQTVIGQEAIAQMKLAGASPDIVIGCCGGGSNFAGLAFPFVPEKAAGKNIRLIGVEPAACPTMTKGIYAYDFGDKSGMTPLLKMDTLGHDFIPPGIHAGGLRYHGMSPLVSLLHREGVVEAVSYPQLKCFEAAMTFARAEGLIVAPETSHAICCVVDEALKAKEEGKEKTILFNLSGHGHFDMAAYEKYFAGELFRLRISGGQNSRSAGALAQGFLILDFADFRDSELSAFSGLQNRKSAASRKSNTSAAWRAAGCRRYSRSSVRPLRLADVLFNITLRPVNLVIWVI